ncbi:hypothetical protein EV182_001597 [Spiromyces aspiralis]|uniref:Uncharacterized protein n=1 Tax=Spiromyces aspiralis TaxID=68401 RepID=A0ACC1HFC8_9FUNG|nr:hypothetical protein EV182_001597 [Spiromyces aspiralis]
MSNPFGIPWPLLTDSYKLTHYKLYPKAQKAVAYGEFRTSFNKDLNDHRMVFYGIRYIIDNYITKRWTERDVALTEAFLATHNTGFTEFPFPKELFMKVSSGGGGGLDLRV